MASSVKSNTRTFVTLFEFSPQHRILFFLRSVLILSSVQNKGISEVFSNTQIFIFSSLMYLSLSLACYMPPNLIFCCRHFNANNIWSTICYYDFVSYLSCVNLLAFKLSAIILLDDIPLCLKYNIKMKQNIYSFRHNYIFILLFLLLAPTFGLIINYIYQLYLSNIFIICIYRLYLSIIFIKYIYHLYL
jgi:hypothetical protein